ncbi:MAG: hypothetical protein AAF371_19245 [Pseudomonadota bacterium]
MSRTEILPNAQRDPSRIVLGATGVIALLSASCCVLPIGLSILGLGGSWLLMLGPFVAYRIPILLAVAAVLAWGWWRVWSQRRCGAERVRAPAFLAFATASFALAASAPLWEAYAARMMFALWREHG